MTDSNFHRRCVAHPAYRLLAIAAFCLSAKLSVAGPNAPILVSEHTLCEEMFTPLFAKHYVGKTIAFDGDFFTDHFENSAVLPQGCRWGWAMRVSSANDAVSNTLDLLDDVRLKAPKGYQRGVHGTFVGKVSTEGGMAWLQIVELRHPVAILRKYDLPVARRP